MSSTTNTQPSFLFPATGYDNRNGVPKSPKSPKVPMIENPLLKRHQFMVGGAPIPTTTTSQNQSRSPLASLSVNRSQLTNKTPGPPPKASLSLMSMSVPQPTEPKETPIGTGFGNSNTPITPPPVNSPRLLEQSQILVNPRSEFRSGESGNWVVSYGYANREEYKELERILTSYGSIIDIQANANWLAIKYESRLAAEKALCSQPIKLCSNSLCGTVRGSCQLLQTLRAQQPNDSLKSAEYGVNAVESRKGTEMMFASAGLSEEDILAQYDEQDQYESDWGHSGSICEKLLAWMFGWEKVLANKLHAD